MSTSTICVDASVIVRLITNRRDRPVWSAWDEWQATRATIVAPGLLFYEVANALYQYQRHEHITVETAVILFRAALALPIDLQTAPRLHEIARDLATSFALPATYDAHYLAVAQELGCELWTADKRLVSTVVGRLPWLRLLAPANDAS